MTLARPVGLVLTRQEVPVLDRSTLAPAAGVARGAYSLIEAGPGSRLQLILIATGSEVSLALAAHRQLVSEGVRCRVVSMPSWELFEAQPAAYRDAVLPPTVQARVSVEAGAPFGWERYVGATGHKIGMETFGASAPLKELQKKFGFTVENVVARAVDKAEAIHAIEGLRHYAGNIEKAYPAVKEGGHGPLVGRVHHARRPPAGAQRLFGDGERGEALGIGVGEGERP